MNHFKSSFLGKEILLSDKCNSIWGASRGGSIYDEQLIYNFYNHIIFNRESINFFDIGSNTGSFIFLPLLNSTIKFTTHTVQCKTIDELFVELGLQSLDLIKIDTEGSELNILKGGAKTIKEFKPSILLEFDNKNTTQFGYMRDDIVDLLKSYGYTTFKLLAESDLYASTL